MDKCNTSFETRLDDAPKWSSYISWALLTFAVWAIPYFVVVGTTMMHFHSELGESILFILTGGATMYVAMHLMKSCMDVGANLSTHPNTPHNTPVSQDQVMGVVGVGYKDAVIAQDIAVEVMVANDDIFPRRRKGCRRKFRGKPGHVVERRRGSMTDRRKREIYSFVGLPYRIDQTKTQ